MLMRLKIHTPDYHGPNDAYRVRGSHTQLDPSLCVAWNRQGRRRAEREIKRLIENNDGCCSLCHGEFSHNSKVYGGIVTYGGAALVGECCESKLALVVLRTKERTAGSPEK